MAEAVRVLSLTSYQTIIHITGALIVMLGLAMFIPALMDHADDNPHWRVFAGSASFCCGTGALLFLATRQQAVAKIRLKDAFVLTTLLWLVLPLFAATPFFGLGLTLTDALFESISGITATGSTVITGLDELPRGILLWRSLLQWIGGIGIIVMAMVLLPFLGIGGMQLFRAESSDRSEENLGRSTNLVTWIGAVYLILTLACALAYGAAGMETFDAICHALTTVSTAGFSTHDASFAHFANPAVEWVAIPFMILGALPFIALIGVLRGDFWRLSHDPQIRWLLAFLAAISVAMAIWLTLTRDIHFSESIRHTTFSVVSIVTTTGYASVDYMMWGPAAAAAFFMLTFVGGCTGSTTGGIKTYRFVILAQVLKRQVRRLRDRSRVELVRYGRTPVPPDVPTAVLAFLILYMASTVIVTLLLAASGLEFVTALSAAVTAISNVGPGIGELVGPTGHFGDLSGSSKAILAFAMILGRLELFTVIVLFDPDFWRW